MITTPSERAIPPASVAEVREVVGYVDSYPEDTACDLKNEPVGPGDLPLRAFALALRRQGFGRYQVREELARMLI